MAKVQQKFFLIRRPATEADQQRFSTLFSQLEQQGYMHHERLGPVPQGEHQPRGGDHPWTEGTVEQIEFRKTLDYNRDERRQARREKRELKPNEFKGIVPDGWTVIGPDDTPIG